MLVKDLIQKLEKLNPESMIVLQKNFKEGFMLCELVLQENGHIGFSGPILHLGEQICFIDQEENKNARD